MCHSTCLPSPSLIPPPDTESGSSKNPTSKECPEHIKLGRFAGVCTVAGLVPKLHPAQPSLCRPLCRFPSGSAWPGRPRLERLEGSSDQPFSASLSITFCVASRSNSGLGLLSARATSEHEYDASKLLNSRLLMDFADLT